MTAGVNWSFVVGEEGDWRIGYVPNRAWKGRIVSGTTIVSGLDLGQQTPESLRKLRVSETLLKKLLPFAGAKGPDAVMAAQRQFEQALDGLLALNRGQTGSGPRTVGAMGPKGILGHAKGPRTHPDGSYVLPKPGGKPTQFVAANTVLGLELTETEREELTTAARRVYYEALASRYDACGPKVKFAALATDLQTSLVSLSWHTGNIWEKTHNAIDVFSAAVRSDWAGVVDGLRGGPIYCLPKYADFRLRRKSEARLVVRGAGLDPNATGPKERAWMLHVVEQGLLRARTA